METPEKIELAMMRVEALMALFLGPFRERIGSFNDHAGKEIVQDDAPTTDLDARMLLFVLGVAARDIADVIEDEEWTRTEREYEVSRAKNSDRLLLLPLLALWLMTVHAESKGGRAEEIVGDDMWPASFIDSAETVFGATDLPSWEIVRPLFLAVRDTLPPGYRLPPEALVLLEMVPPAPISRRGHLRLVHST